MVIAVLDGFPFAFTSCGATDTDERGADERDDRVLLANEAADDTSDETDDVSSSKSGRDRERERSRSNVNADSFSLMRVPTLANSPALP